MPEKKIEEDLIKTEPRLAKYFKAHKIERAKIERCFGKLVTIFKILNTPFKGRGNRYKHLGQIVMLGAQISNLIYFFDKFMDKESRKTFIDNNPPTSFADILKQC